MLRVLLLALPFMLSTLLRPSPASAQNAAPAVSDVVVSVQTNPSRIIVSYDLADAEGEACDVQLRASNDGGTTFRVPMSNTSGDIGPGIAPATDRQIVWDPSQAGLIPGQEIIVQVVADDGYVIDPQTLVDAVDIERMRADMLAMEGRRHYNTGRQLMEDTKDLIHNEFVQAGLQARRQAFNYSTWRAENVIGRHPGVSDDAATVIIDGHFDTVANTPGADDNASGTVGMLEAMRVLSPYRFDKSLVFIGFDLEEVGLVGAARYVFGSGGMPKWQQTEAVINFEMIGFTCGAGCDAFGPVGDYIHNIGDEQSTHLRADFDSLAAVFAPELAVESTLATDDNPNFRRSDHARFWDAGIPALFLTDGANFRNPHYHQLTDLESTINYTFMANIVKTAIACAVQWAGLQHSGVGQSAPFLAPAPTPVESQSVGEVKQRYRDD